MVPSAPTEFGPRPTSVVGSASLDPSRIEERRAIIEGARRCAARRGLAATSITAVCAETGVDRATFNRRFAGKQELIISLLDDDWYALEGVITQLDMAVLTPRERLEKMVEVMLGLADDVDRARVRTDLWTYVLGDAELKDWAAQRLAGRRAVVRDWVGRLGGQDANPDMLLPANAMASVLLAFCDGLMLHSTADHEAFKWSNIRVVVEVLLSGLTE